MNKVDDVAIVLNLYESKEGKHLTQPPLHRLGRCHCAATEHITHNHKLSKWEDLSLVAYFFLLGCFLMAGLARPVSYGWGLDLQGIRS